MSDLLSLTEVSAHYGTSHVLFDVSLRVGTGEIVCLLGRNGAGKTTTIKSVMGLTEVSSGRITFCGDELRRRRTDQIARLGVGYVADAASSSRTSQSARILRSAPRKVRRRSASSGRSSASTIFFRRFVDWTRTSEPI